MSEATASLCEDCGADDDVRTYTDPESDEPAALCRTCARNLYDDDTDVTAGLSNAEEDPDEEFRDTCITAADYYREGDY